MLSHSWASIHFSDRPLTLTPGAVWFVNQRENGRESIDRVDTSDGTVRQIVLGTNCLAKALAAAGKAVWFTEGCKRETGEVGVTRASVDRIGPNGKITRHPIPKDVEPLSLAVGPEGTVWFGAEGSEYRPWAGRITKGGQLAEYRLPKESWPLLITAGGEGRLWFPTSTGGNVNNELDSIGVGGRLGEPICADPTCRLATTALTTAPDGSLWYSLRTPNPLGGGGGSQIYWTTQIEDEAGFVAHLVP